MIALYGLALPEIKPGDHLAQLLLDSSLLSCGGIRQGDIFVVTSKIVSKAEGLLVNLDEVRPSKKARWLSAKTGLDAHYLEIVLQESDEMLFILPLAELMEKNILDPKKLGHEGNAQAAIKAHPCEIFVRRGSELCSGAGIDASNFPKGKVGVLPKNHDQAAKKIRQKILELTGIDTPVIITDTEYTLALGTVDIARGVSGLKPVAHKFGQPDRFGKPKFGGADYIAHELASAAALLMGQTTEGIPAVLIRGFNYEPDEAGMEDYVLEPAILRQMISLAFKRTFQFLGLHWLWGIILFILGKKPGGKEGRKRNNYGYPS